MFRITSRFVDHNEGKLDITGDTYYYYGAIHYYDEDLPLPASLSDVQELVEKHIKAIRTAKRSFVKGSNTITACKRAFLEDLGTKTLTLSPKPSFDLQLRALHVLYPEASPCLEVEEKEANIYEYTLYNDSYANDKTDEAHFGFLIDDHRYEVGLDLDVCDGYANDLYILTIHEEERDIQRDEDNIDDDDNVDDENGAS
jgi:hypothetical protein